MGIGTYREDEALNSALIMSHRLRDLSTTQRSKDGTYRSINMELNDVMDQINSANLHEKSNGFLVGSKRLGSPP